jgi:hypothetical protein
MLGIMVAPPRFGETLALRPRDWNVLSAHLFGQDDGWQGGVILAERVNGPRGARLLGREIILARREIDFPSGQMDPWTTDR